MASLFRQNIVAILVSLSLLAAMLPQQILHAHGAQQSRESQPEETKGKSRRVNTDDDWSLNHPVLEPSDPAEPVDAALPGRGKGIAKISPFVPTPMAVVKKMLELAEVTSEDMVYDLGSGDGRVVILAAQKYGAKAVGVELDGRLAQHSAEKVRELALDGLVTIIEGDLLQTDIKPATVVTVYLLPHANERLRPLLERNLKPGARVVAHDFRIPDWCWERTAEVQVGAKTHFLYLYRIPVQASPDAECK